MKNVISIFLCLFLFVMTAQELQWGEFLLRYYSGDLDRLPRNETIFNGYIYGTEQEKKVLIKQFLTDVVLPREESTKTAQEEAVTNTEDKITIIKNYNKQILTP